MVNIIAKVKIATPLFSFLFKIRAAIIVPIKVPIISYICVGCTFGETKALIIRIPELVFSLLK